MNTVILSGRLVRDPEIRESAGGGTTIGRYTLAVDRPFKREGEPTADFINCVVFGRGADFAGKYFQKGTKLNIRGRIQTGSYTKKDGTKVNTTDIIVDEQEFAESKSSGSGSKTPVTGKDGNNGDALGDAFMSIPDGISEELPFD